VVGRQLVGRRRFAGFGRKRDRELAEGRCESVGTSRWAVGGRLSPVGRWERGRWRGGDLGNRGKFSNVNLKCFPHAFSMFISDFFFFLKKKRKKKKDVSRGSTVGHQPDS
jgi:hypothetical protein